MTMHLTLPVRFMLLIALLVAPAMARAQSFITGAEVFAFRPNIHISSTLRAAPSSPSYNWSTAVWFWDRGESLEGLHNSAFPSGAVGASTGRAFPSQNGLPLVFTTAFVNHSDIPPGPGQHEGVPVFFSTTGFRVGNNVPPGGMPTAGVVFGPNNTAQIGFAPAGASISSFLDFPIRIRVTGVFNGIDSGC
jgi:hypothetical protein